MPFAEGIESPAPRFSWSLVPLVSARALSQTAFELNLWLSPEAAAPPFWASGRVASVETSLVTLSRMPPLPSSSRLWWRVRSYDADGAASAWSSVASFTTGIATWSGIDWVCGPGGSRGGENLFRAPFALPVSIEEIVSALVHVAGLGVHEVSFNGAPAGELGPLRKLDGGWTDYAKRVFYTTHDITSALLPSENVLGVQLGASWFNDDAWYKRPPYGWPSATNGGGFSYDAPRLLRLQLVIRLVNGSQISIATSADGSGGATFYATQGPIVFDSLYDGETFDGRRAAALCGWNAPGFLPAPGEWRPVVSASSNTTINPALNAVITSQPFEPTMRLTRAFPVNSWEAGPGIFVFDFGSNGIGTVRWTFRGLPAGTNVTMRYAEVIQHPPYGPTNSSLYFDNLRNAHATDFYFADGSEDVEVFEPSFSWHGFRYAQVSGLVSPPAMNDVVVVRQANAVTPGASAAFPSEILGKIEAMAVNTIWSNLQGGPGSCGQRDERQFFTGDTQVSALTSMQSSAATYVLVGLERAGRAECGW